MSRKHISEDGKIRNCTAKTPESCTAIGPDGNKAEHFPEYYAAKRRREEMLEAQYGKTNTFSNKNSGDNFNKEKRINELEIAIDANIRRDYELRARTIDATQREINLLKQEISVVNVNLEAERAELAKLKENENIDSSTIQNDPIMDIKIKLNSPNWYNFTPKELQQLSPDEWKEQQRNAINKMGYTLKHNKKLAALQKTFRQYPENSVIRQKYLDEANRSGYAEADKMRQISNKALAQDATLKELEIMKAHLSKFPQEYNNVTLNDDVSSFMFNKNVDTASYEDYAGYHSISEDDWAKDREAAIQARDFLEKNKFTHKTHSQLQKKCIYASKRSPSTLMYFEDKIKKDQIELSKDPTNKTKAEVLRNDIRIKFEIEKAIEDSGKPNEVLQAEYNNAKENWDNVDNYIGITELNRRINTAENALMAYGWDAIDGLNH